MIDTPTDQKTLEAAKAVEDDMRWMAADRHSDIQPLVRERLIEGADIIERFRAALASLPMPVAGTPERWPEKVTAEMTNAFAAEAKRLGPDALQYPALLFNAMLTAAPLASEGKTEPVAWRYEHQFGANERWHVYFTDEGPPPSPPYRNVTPLFASPPRAEAAVIERCAKVAEEFADKARYVGPDANLKIAAAIRALSTPPGAP